MSITEGYRSSVFCLINEGGENTQGHEPVPSSGKHQLRISVFVARWNFSS